MVSVRDESYVQPAPRRIWLRRATYVRNEVATCSGALSWRAPAVPWHWHGSTNSSPHPPSPLGSICAEEEGRDGPRCEGSGQRGHAPRCARGVSEVATARPQGREASGYGCLAH
eukprot:6201940-Pleurochrysis_carterae.AAC.5